MIKVWALVMTLWSPDETKVLAHFETHAACESALALLNRAWTNPGLNRRSFCVEVVAVPPYIK